MWWEFTLWICSQPLTPSTLTKRSDVCIWSSITGCICYKTEFLVCYGSASTPSVSKEKYSIRSYYSDAIHWTYFLFRNDHQIFLDMNKRTTTYFVHWKPYRNISPYNYVNQNWYQWVNNMCTSLRKRYLFIWW